MTLVNCFTDEHPSSIPIEGLTAADFAVKKNTLSAFQQQWLASIDFTAAEGQVAMLPDEQGQLAQVWYSKSADQPWQVATLPARLPARPFHLVAGNKLDYLAWGLQAYSFDRYRQTTAARAKLSLPQHWQELRDLLKAIYLTRDLINTPTADLGPAGLAEATQALAQQHAAQTHTIVGDALLAQNFPAIHAVGRASHEAPRLIELRWGDADRPRLTLVGKGVCFDSGGLDLKPSTNMRLMKKDMGGAAHVLGLAAAIMSAQLPIALRVLIPAVENAIGGNAYRPGDVLATRRGLSVEVGNTDAEGRLILADALSYAQEEPTDCLMDLATLTGAARVALGTDVPALFCNRDTLAEALLAASQQECDPLWRMPLHAPYLELLKSPIADCSNIGSSMYGGAITAALFLQQFVEAKTPWFHLDIMAWNTSNRPGRPEGGEAMGLRALFTFIKDMWLPQQQ